MTGRGNNTYLVAGRGRTAILVDAGVGHPDHLDAIDALLLGRDVRLTETVVTHGHADHAAGAPHIAARHPDAVFKKYPWPPIDLQYCVPWVDVADGNVVMAGHEALTAL